jgi:hypothetical protein
MPDMSQLPSITADARPSAAMLDAVPADDDFALGCECAYPALQIERWGQQVQPYPPGLS